MLKTRIYSVSLFILSILIVIVGSKHITVDTSTYLLALLIYLLFSNLYFHLRVIGKSGHISVDYAISYSLSISLFAGPFGLLIFETLYRFSVYFRKRLTKTDDPDEFFDTFYNVGSFVTANTIAYWAFTLLFPFVETIPFGFWLLILLLISVSNYLSDTFLIGYFNLLGQLKKGKEIVDFYKSRSILDMGKTAFTNGLLLVFLNEGKWEIVVCLFILNYLVSHSFVYKSQSIQDKIERDKFEQMAYTDFLTGVSNRAFMDRKIAELNESNECIGIIVADIDKFKSINDAYNHAIGDQVIQHFANTLKSSLNSFDYLFRSGGEEFTIFLTNRNYEQCIEVVKGIMSQLGNSYITTEYKGNIVEINYTSSFGLYFFKLNEFITLEKAYIYADQLLLKSKEQGRNTFSAENALVPTSIN